MEDRIFYTVKDLAKILGCKEENVRVLVRKGLLPGRKLGRRIIFLREELEVALRELPLVNPRSFRRGF